MEKNKIAFEWQIILKDLVKNFWVIIMAGLIGLMGIYIVAHSIYTPEYTAKAMVVVTAKGSSNTAVSLYNISSEMAEVFSKIFVDPLMEAEAAKYLGVGGFDGDISASVLNNTNFVELTVTSDTPQKAYELLSAVLKVYPEISENIFDNAVINILSLPSMPLSPSNEITTSNMWLVTFGCAAMAALAIVVLSVIRDTVKNEASFNSMIDAKLFGVIPHERKPMTVKERINKKKKSLLIDGNAYISMRFSENFHKIAAKLEYFKARNGDKVFVVTSVAENEGKSTVASNIAIALAEKGNKVVLIDFDGKKPALYKIFSAKYKEISELGNLFEGKIAPDEFRLRKYKKTNLSLALNVRRYPDSFKWLESGAVDRFLDILGEQVDYIIIDTAPVSADASVTDVMKKADGTLLVVRTDVVKTSVINDAVLTIDEVGGKMLGCILNDVYTDDVFTPFTGSYEYGNYYSKKAYNNYYDNHKQRKQQESNYFDSFEDTEG